MYSLKIVPFFKVRAVLESEENPKEITLKRLLLYNLASKPIGASTIKVEKPGEKMPVDMNFPVVRSVLDYFCGQYKIDWFADGEAEENQNFTVVLIESKLNNDEMAKKVFSFEAEIRQFEKACSSYFVAKRISNFSTGKQAEDYAAKAEKHKKEAEELYEKLKSEGIIRENFIYTPMHMYIFPKRKMENGYYKRANFFKVKWLTPNVCITNRDTFFKKYCEISKHTK